MHAGVDRFTKPTDLLSRTKSGVNRLCDLENQMVFLSIFKSSTDATWVFKHKSASQIHKIYSKTPHQEDKGFSYASA